MILALNEFAVFLQAATVPFPGFQGILEGEENIN